MLHPLRALLERLISTGDLTYIDSGGRSWRYGDQTGLPVTFEMTQPASEWALALDPQLALGEAFMSGALQMRQGTIYDFIVLLFHNLALCPRSGWEKSVDSVRMALRRVHQFNPAQRARRNVAHHYDIDGSIYDLFLDADRQYSCAYFGPDDDLETAQLAKKRHLAAKLDLRPGHRVLDIGCGWGGLGLYLASVADAQVTGVTLSEAQIGVAQERARRQGLDRRVRFALEDYRDVRGRFDRIVSVGMFEHVGVNHYDTFVAKVRDLLTNDGVAVIHTIGRSDGPGFTNPFIAKYIFPGGYYPALSEILPAIERSGLVLSDVEILRLHYAETLKAWRERFLARRDVAVHLKGEAFARMWEFYLAGAEAAFRYQGLVVFQLQLACKIDTLPLKRDYITRVEHELAEAEATPQERPRMAGE